MNSGVPGLAGTSSKPGGVSDRAICMTSSEYLGEKRILATLVSFVECGYRRASAMRLIGVPSRRAITRRVGRVWLPNVGCQHECLPAPPATMMLIASGDDTM